MLKIISQTNSKILISTPPKTFALNFIGFIFAFMFGSIFSFIPIFIALMTSSEIGVLRINCDRVEPQQVDCQISKSKFFDLVQQEPLNYKFVNSFKYNVVEGEDSEGDTINWYNFSLLTKSGEKFPFKNTSLSTATSVTSSLNPFLLSQQESIRYTLDEPPIQG